MSDPLESLRNRIDELDRRLIEALAERQRVVTEIAGLKADPALPLRDAERERDLLSRVSALAGARGGGMWRGGGGLPADREFSYRIDYRNVRSPEPDESAFDR